MFLPAAAGAAPTRHASIRQPAPARGTPAERGSLLWPAPPQLPAAFAARQKRSPKPPGRLWSRGRHSSPHTRPQTELEPKVLHSAPHRSPGSLDARRQLNWAAEAAGAQEERSAQEGAVFRQCPETCKGGGCCPGKEGADPARVVGVAPFLHA